MTSSSQRIDEALQALKLVIEETVRQEQLHDQLTNLPNDRALAALLESAVETNRRFWLAFVEGDYFKRVNDAFGYENGNALLCAIAKQLNACCDFFPGPAQAFRAHGDEFYLFGDLEEREGSRELIAAGLEQIRQAVGSIRLRIANIPQLMSCTVSIGWITSEEESVLSEGVRAIRHYLKITVDEAKCSGRNRVVRYQPSFSVSPLVSIRDTCTACRTSFTCDTPRDTYAAGSLHCPNCGADISRPPASPSLMVKIPTI